jgi:ABC-2 type transport system permease protein
MSKYLALGWLAFRERMHSPIALAVIQFNMLLRVWVLSQLYQASFAASGRTHVAGFGLTETVWSLMLVQAVMLSRWPTIARIITLDIREGGFVIALQRPYSYALAMLLQAIGRQFPVLLLNLITGCVVAHVLVGAPNISLNALLFAVVILILGLLLDLGMLLCLGLCALWLDASESLEWIYDKAFVVFGGAFLPLAFMPSWLQPWLELLPFGLLYSSASVVLLQGAAVEPALIVIRQVLWLLLVVGLVNFIFSNGVRHVAHNGG